MWFWALDERRKRRERWRAEAYTLAMQRDTHKDAPTS